MNNRDWSDKILQRVDPNIRHRWVIYEDLLRDNLCQDTVWIDCGCGDNGIVEELDSEVKYAVGVDINEPGFTSANFVKADLHHLPFPPHSADVITLRFVVEHMQDIRKNVSDIIRVLKPGGKLIVLTTNVLCPIVFLARIIPFGIKSFIISSLFKVRSVDVLKTYHRFNTPGKFRMGITDLSLEEMYFLSDLNYSRRPVFLILLLWHLLTRHRSLQIFRANILAVFEKDKK